MTNETSIEQKIAEMEAELARLRREAAATEIGGSQVGQDVTTNGGDFVGRDKRVGRDEITVIAESGATVVVNPSLPEDDADPSETDLLQRYLHHLIAETRYLQLQGIRSGGRLVHIELAQIYITLRANPRGWLQEERPSRLDDPALGAQHFSDAPPPEPKTKLTVNDALAHQRRLVVLGDPGSGKTTLLRYLALTYALSLASDGEATPVADRLGLPDEDGALPLFLPLRKVGAYLRQRQPEDGTDGPALLLEYWHRVLQQAKQDVPSDFFEPYLQAGRAVVLLDGLDEVAEPTLRRRVARLVEAFTRTYPACRYVVTCRVKGYQEAARLGEAYVEATVRPFSLADIRLFLTHWQRLVAIGEHGPGAVAEQKAASQTEALMTAITSNERIRDLAINPLMLTVIALVHRDRVKLPDRRAELYAEAVDVLLGKWDEARGVLTQPILPTAAPFDAGDKRLLLQQVALYMQEQEIKEIEVATLQALLNEQFTAVLGDPRLAEKAARTFLQVIEERAGLLIGRGEGWYAFSHLTFQEYLAALAVAGRDDYLRYTLDRVGNSWWRETILLTAGCLSLLSQTRTTQLIRAIARHRAEPEPYHNLVLAAACGQDVGESRLNANLLQEIQAELRAGVEKPPPWHVRWLNYNARDWIAGRSTAMEALVQSGAGFWSLPYGEPEWVEIPSGECWVGEGKDKRKMHLDTFAIARTPITNAQYQLFVKATGHEPPKHWEDGRPPKGLESHPVVNVTWYDAVAYCRWLSEQIGQTVRLPHEWEWEKVARGRDGRLYPWGDEFDKLKCNTLELGLGTTTPVGIFPEGASPYGVLDMSGNVWEWCQDKYSDPDQTQVDDSGDSRGLRGGSWFNPDLLARAAGRNDNLPLSRDVTLGFRVVVAGASPSIL